jgi:hypothetical protein
VTSVLACLIGGCGNPLPGTLLGTYQVTATGQSNSCGSALGAPTSDQFDVQISKDSGTLYWSWLNDSPIASGVLSSSNQATLTATQSLNVDGTDAGAGPCTMTRTDTLVVTLGSGTPPSTFSGTLSYAFGAAAGADCSDQLTSGGGMYAELPCEVAFTIAGTVQ